MNLALWLKGTVSRRPNAGVLPVADGHGHRPYHWQEPLRKVSYKSDGVAIVKAKISVACTRFPALPRPERLADAA